MKKVFPAAFLLCCMIMAAAERPVEWADRMTFAGTPENLYRLDRRVWRSAQPDRDEFAVLEKRGLKSVLSLRRHHPDKVHAGSALKLYRLKTDAGELTAAELIAALRIIRDAPPPVLIHCWRGSDRTGAVCAAYRIVFQNWTPEAAMREFSEGGYGYAALIYPSLRKLISETDWAALRKQLESETGR